MMNIDLFTEKLHKAARNAKLLSGHESRLRAKIPKLVDLCSVDFPDAFFDLSRSFRIISRLHSVSEEQALKNAIQDPSLLLDIFDIAVQHSKKRWHGSNIETPHNDYIYRRLFAYGREHDRLPGRDCGEFDPGNSTLTWSFVIRRVHEEQGLTPREFIMAYIEDTKDIALPDWFPHFRRPAYNLPDNDYIAQQAIEVRKVDGILPHDKGALIDKDGHSFSWGAIRWRLKKERNTTIRQIVSDYEQKTKAGINPALDL